LLIGIYGGHIGKLWFLVVGCTRSILQMKNEVCLLQKKYVGVQPFIAANKTKEN
jgi:hypothetical protein